MRILTSACICFAIAVCSVTIDEAKATTLSTTGHALNNGSGPDGGIWRGSENYSGTLFFDSVDADVEFAVFAPGDFQSFLDENSINFVDPAPGEFIYAYQILNIAGGTTGVTGLSVGLDGNEALGAIAPTFIPVAAGYGTYSPAPIQDPGGTGGGPGVTTSSVWNPLAFTPGEASGILFYSSPDGPELGYSTVNGGIAAQQKALSLPNPVPEPTTLLFAVMGFALMNYSARDSRR